MYDFLRRVSANAPKGSILGLGLALVSLSLVLYSSAWAKPLAQTPDTRPNIVLLVADDAGYSDFGSWGGEATTPAIDALSASGIRLTNFRALPTCSPTRSALLTGVTNHLNGFGTMAGNLSKDPLAPQVGQFGYSGYLNDRVVTVATLLQDAGYHTYHVGKWHLAEEGEDENGEHIFERGTWPIDRGFEKSFGILEGGGDHFGFPGRVNGSETHFVENETLLTELPEDYYSAKNNTDKALEYIAAGRTADGDQRRPFFLYYASTLPHDPNQVPAEYIKQSLIDLYLAKGWDGIRADRLTRLKDLDLVPATLELSPTSDIRPDWDDENDPRWTRLMNQVTTSPFNTMWGITTVAEYKRTLAKKMAVYTGMIEYFDHEVGRIVDALKAAGEYDNTVFIFLSDNGADATPWDFLYRNWLLARGIDNSYDNIGLPNSFVANGTAWAQVANTPFLGGKALVAEGGVRDPLVISYVNGNITPDSKNNASVAAVDIGATILDYAGVTHPAGSVVTPARSACTGTYEERTGICPMDGKSLRGLVEGTAQQVRLNTPLVIELFGNVNKSLLLEEENAMWKILKLGDFGFTQNSWTLFNLAVDVETAANDLSTQNPEKLKELIDLYNEYEYNVGFVPADGSAVKNVSAGEIVTHTFVFTNTNTLTDTFTFSCQSAWPCTLDEQSATLQAAALVSTTLPAGQAVTLQATVSVSNTVGGSASNISQITVLATESPAYSANFTAVTVTAADRQLYLPIIQSAAATEQ